MPQQDPPTDPPPDKMVRTVLWEDHSVGFYSELVSRESARFQENSPMKRGKLYNSTIGSDQRVVDLYGTNLFFLRETVPLGGDIRGVENDKWVKWVWSSDHLADNSCGAKVEFFLEDIAYPVYTRETTEIRDHYEASPSVSPGSPLTALLYIKVTAAGSGYVETDTVVVTGTGTGAAAQIVVNASGGITNVIMTNEGSGYTAAPAISVTSATGSGATLEGIIQDQTAVLIHQEKQELPQDDPYQHEFVKIIRVYRRIQGPPLTGQKFDFKLGVPTPFSVREQAAGTGGAAEVEPIDTIREKATFSDTAAVAAALRSIVMILPSTAAHLDLPDVLESVTIFYEYSSGTGNYHEESDGLVTGLYATSQGHAEGSASVSPVIIPVVRSLWASNLPVTDVGFFLAIPFDAYDVSGKTTVLTATHSHTVTITITAGAVVTWTGHGFSNNQPVAFDTTGALPTGLLTNRTYFVINKTTDTFQLSATVGGSAITTSGTQSGVHTGFEGPGDFSQYDPASHTIVAIGGKCNISVETKVRAGISGSDDVKNIGKGFSVETGTIVRETHIAPTLHGPMNVTLDPMCPPVLPVSVTSDSSVTAILFGTVTESITRTESVGLTVLPATLPGTSVTTIPTTGTHIYRSTSELYQSSVDANGIVTRFAMVHVILLNMDNIIPAGSGAGTGSFGTPRLSLGVNSGPSSGDIQIAGHINPAGSNTTVVYEYGTSVDYGSSSSGSSIITNLYDNTPVVHNLTGLLGGNFYHIRAKVTNSVGTIYGPDMYAMAMI